MRRAGVRIRLITDADVGGAIATADPPPSRAAGVGGAPEGVLAAAARAPRRCGTAGGPAVRRRRTCSAAAAITPRGAAGAEQHVDAGVGVGRRDRAGDVAVPDQADARAAWRTSRDHLLVALAVEDDGGAVLDLSCPLPRRSLSGSRVALRADSILPRAIGPTAILFMYVSGAFRNWPCSAIAMTVIASGSAGGAQVRALERIDGDVDLGASVVAVADLLADVEHRRLVALAFTDDDGPAHVHVAEGATHRLDGDAVSAAL